MITPRQSIELFLVKQLRTNHKKIIDVFLDETERFIQDRSENKIESPLAKEFLSMMRELFASPPDEK